jgi:hypothetical protein
MKSNLESIIDFLMGGERKLFSKVDKFILNYYLQVHFFDEENIPESIIKSGLSIQQSEL